MTDTAEEVQTPGTTRDEEQREAIAIMKDKLQEAEKQIKEVRQMLEVL